MSKVAITFLCGFIWSSFFSIVFSKQLGPGESYANLSPEEAAEVLKENMGGTDRMPIIKVLATREYLARREVADVYKEKYGSNLVAELQNIFSGDARKTIVALMTPPIDYIASEVHNAVDGPGTDEDALIELLLCARTNEEMRQIKEAYSRLFGSSMEDDVIDDTSGDFQKVLVLAMKGQRSEAPGDRDRAKPAARALHYAGVRALGTDEDVFINILLGESYEQVDLISEEYDKYAGHTLEDAIDMEMSGDLMDALTTIVVSARSKPLYFARKINKAVKGMGTDEDALIRILVSRFEVDLNWIGHSYPQYFDESLETAIKDDTYNSGVFSDILIALVRRR